VGLTRPQIASVDTLLVLVSCQAYHVCVEEKTRMWASGFHGMKVPENYTAVPK
jgi:hypothetical protein